MFQSFAFAEVNSGAIHLDGKIDPGKLPQCASGKAELFLTEPLLEKNSNQHTLLYQLDVIPNGSFSFNLTPGLYEANVVTNSGCEGRERFTLVASEPKKTIKIMLEKKKGDKK